MTRKDLMDAYIELQKTINGDIVIRLTNVELDIDSNETDVYIWGDESEPYDDSYNELYEGNMKDFLESFNDEELNTGWCRIDETMTRNDGKIGGIKFDFVF